MGLLIFVCLSYVRTSLLAILESFCVFYYNIFTSSSSKITFAWTTIEVSCAFVVAAPKGHLKTAIIKQLFCSDKFL